MLSLLAIPLVIGVKMKCEIRQCWRDARSGQPHCFTHGRQLVAGGLRTVLTHLPPHNRPIEDMFPSDKVVADALFESDDDFWKRVRAVDARRVRYISTACRSYLSELRGQAADRRIELREE
jgi:hypothetical protein